MQGSKRYDVFISYHHRDAEAVHGIARRLADEASLEPFVDAWNLVPGDRFTTPLADAVRASRCVAVFKGPEGMSEWVESETELAIARVSGSFQCCCLGRLKSCRRFCRYGHGWTFAGQPMTPTHSMLSSPASAARLQAARGILKTPGITSP